MSSTNFEKQGKDAWDFRVLAETLVDLASSRAPLKQPSKRTPSKKPVDPLLLLSQAALGQEILEFAFSDEEKEEKEKKSDRKHCNKVSAPTFDEDEEENDKSLSQLKWSPISHPPPTTPLSPVPGTPFAVKLKQSSPSPRTEDIVQPSALDELSESRLHEVEQKLAADVTRRLEDKLQTFDDDLAGISSRAQNEIDRKKQEIRLRTAETRRRIAQEEENSKREVAEFLSKLQRQAQLRSQQLRLQVEEYVKEEEQKKIRAKIELEKKILALKQQKEKEEEEKKKKLEEEKKKQLEEIKQQELRAAKEKEIKENKSQSPTTRPSTSRGLDSASKAKARIAIYNENKKLADLFESNPAHKDAILQLKMNINRPVQQIASNKLQIQKTTKTLIPQLRAAKERGGGYFAYVLKVIAQSIVTQGEERISKHQASAFSFADVAYLLCALEPQFLNIFLATLHLSCVYTMPIYLDRQEFKDMKAYKEALGYKQDRDSKEKDGFETEETYFERMVGFMSLYSAFMQVDYQGGERHPHGMGAAWTWAARICNKPPRTATASILLAFLEVAGYSMNKVYPRQFKKIVYLIAKHMMPRIATKTPAQIAARNCLDLWLREHIRGDQLIIEEPPGRRIPDTQTSDASNHRD